MKRPWILWSLAVGLGIGFLGLLLARSVGKPSVAQDQPLNQPAVMEATPPTAPVSGSGSNGVYEDAVALPVDTALAIEGAVVPGGQLMLRGEMTVPQDSILLEGPSGQPSGMASVVAAVVVPGIYSLTPIQPAGASCGQVDDTRKCEWTWEAGTGTTETVEVEIGLPNEATEPGTVTFRVFGTGHNARVGGWKSWRVDLANGQAEPVGP